MIANPVIMAATPYDRWVDGEFVYEPGDYAMEARQVAESERVPFMDHTEIIADRYDEFGQTVGRELFNTGPIHIRSRATEWNIKPDRVGIKGFSDGREIAALAENSFDAVEPTPSDPIDCMSCRPDFAVLGYRGIRADNFTIPKNMPPTFLVLANDDSPAAAVAQSYSKLTAQNITAEVHNHVKGGRRLFSVRDDHAIGNLSAGVPDR
jgi:hypothetical protein